MKVQPFCYEQDKTIGYTFFDCPGCGQNHGIWVHDRNPVTKAIWIFNGDLNRPTFAPSIRVKGEKNGVPYMCHFFVRDGFIEFCSDCTHALAGKIVELPDIEE
jgi:hypothetical protein